MNKEQESYIVSRTRPWPLKGYMTVQRFFSTTTDGKEGQYIAVLGGNFRTRRQAIRRFKMPF